jgi:amino acid adenylation domain-containing protein
MSGSILELIRQTALTHGAKTAVFAGDESVDYDSLHARANRLARAILKAGGGRDRIVAVCLPRGISMIVALFAVMKSGSAYLPISPLYPSQRIAEILADSGAGVLLAEEGYAIPQTYWGVRLDPADPALGRFDAGELEVVVEPGDLAYVIYTSGSTGRPKGVAVEHGALANRILWMQSEYPISPADVLLQKTVYTFDVSVWEIFWWAMYGASVALLPPEQENNVRLVHQLIRRHGVTVAHFVPTVLALFVDYAEARGEPAAGDAPRYMFASGERLPNALVNRYNAVFRGNSLLVNLYGPTEAAIDVTHFPFFYRGEPYDAAPLGHPIWNTRLYVMDSSLIEVPDGDEGELCIAGICLARGYHKQPELTSERFVAHPRLPGERIYRTGDLVRRDPVTRDIHYIGRRDSQIKLRGLRIEPGEIEHHLGAIEGVTEGVVVPRELGGNQYLWAFVRGRPGLCELDLKAALAERLPAYMVPSRIVQVECFPLSPNGKLDYRRLLDMI